MNENHVNLVHPVREVLPKAAKFNRRSQDATNRSDAR